MIQAQGGDLAYVDNPDLLPEAGFIEDVPVPQTEYLEGVHARMVGETAVLLGAGRSRKGVPIDHAVGIQIHHKIGDYIEKGNTLFTLNSNDELELLHARDRLLEAHTWNDQQADPVPHFYDVIQ